MMHENSINLSQSQTPELSVTELSDALKITIDRAFGIVRIKGEVSGFKPASSGHIYFNLKDDKSILKAVCWRGVAASLKVKIEEGMEVVVQGKIAIYQGGSYYQIIASNIEVSGIGALLALLEKRKKQLEAEGLFALARKRRIPFMPRIIGVITSPTGAVIRDILHRIADRFPVHVIVWPVAVQGTGAAEQIANAIMGMNKLAEGLRPDTIIVARGGGSVEDLWCFNEEIVVRAAASSSIPLISAVGHETDTTLIDFASDKRAPTPTAAAEMSVPVKLEMQAAIIKTEERLKRTLPNMLRLKELRLSSLVAKLAEVERKFLKAEARLDAIAERIRSALVLSVAKNQTRIVNAEKLLEMNISAVLRNNTQRLFTASRLFESLQYKNVLKRGFVVAKSSNGKVVSSVEIMKKNALIKLEFADGEVDVMQVNAKTSAKALEKKNQGALF